MLICRAHGLLALMVFLSACNLGRPEVTLTLAPIDTRTPDATGVMELLTATTVKTATSTPTATVTLSPSATFTPAITVTETPRATDTDTSTPTVTDAPTATDTGTPTATASDTSAATDTAIPSETPSATNAPTEAHAPTATNTNLPTATDTDEPTAKDTAAPIATSTLSPTMTEAPTVTPTATDTVAPLTADTPTDHARPTPTRILFDTATPTDTQAPTETPQVSVPQQIEVVEPTATSSKGPEVLILAQPTWTPLPTLNQTELAKLIATPMPRPTLPPTWTAAPTLPPTNTAVAPREATAIVNIAAPDIDSSVISTPIDVTRSELLDAPTTTPSPTVTPVQPTVAIRSDLLQPAIQPIISQPTTFDISGASTYQYDVGAGQIFTFENIQLQGGVRLFLRNPVDPNSFLRTDYKGMLRYQPINAAQESEMSYSPFFAGFASGIGSIDQNKNRIVELDWSADGTRFSFRIDPPPGTDNANAGVWFWQPQTNLESDPTYAILRDCVAAGYKTCNMVNPSSARFWKTISVEWSPISGDNSVLLTLRLPEFDRNALAITQAVRDPKHADNAPSFFRYDYGSWNPDGRSITVSGRRPDGRVIIGVVDRNLQGEQIIFDGSARGLWLRDAVLRPDGQYLALGRPGAPGSGPLALYDQNGNQLSDFVGGAPPEEVRWFPDRSAVVVTVQGQQFTVDVASRAVSNDTGLTSNPQFGARVAAEAAIPDRVLVDSEYAPGEQLRVSVPYLNVRQQPSTSSGIVGGLSIGDYVAIFAGPHTDESYRWWRVQTATGVFGWIAVNISGAPTLRRP